MAANPHRTWPANRAIHNILKRSVRSALFASLALATIARGDVADQQRVLQRADVVNLPAPLKSVLGRMARRPHTYSPMRAFAEADEPSQLFQYYVLDTTGFQPNIFTAIIPGINDGAIPTAANAANGQLRTIGAVRVVLEPKPGLPTDPEDVEAFIDIFTDISGLFVINNESGWYEGWMIHDLVVPDVAPPRSNGHAQFGTMTSADAAAVAAMGSNHNVPGKLFTRDGGDVRFPSANDHFPEQRTNLVPLFLSMGAVQLPAAERLPCILGVQRIHELGLPALRGAFDWRCAGHVCGRQAVRGVVVDTRLRSFWRIE